MKRLVNIFTVLLLLFSGSMATSAQDNLKMKYVKIVHIENNVLAKGKAQPKY